MARLTALPSVDIIRGFKGTLDFYLWKGLPCVRAWPRWRPARQTDASKASAALFGAVVKGYNLLGEGPLTAFREAATDQTRSARDIYVSAVLGHLHDRTAPEPPPPPEEQMYDAYLCLRDLKAQNTPGGAFNAGAWRTRDLTEEQADPSNICTLVANQFVLAPGNYRAIISCPGYQCEKHQARLYNVTGAAILLLGTSLYTWDTGSQCLTSIIQGRFTVTAAQTLEVQHQCSQTKAVDGFGRAANFGQEVYTIAEFWREIEP